MVLVFYGLFEEGNNQGRSSESKPWLDGCFAVNSIFEMTEHRGCDEAQRR